MTTIHKQNWPKLMALVAVLMLSACGGTPGGSSDVASSPTPLVHGSEPGAAVSSTGSPVVIGYDDGSVYRFNGDTTTPNEDFDFLAYGPGSNSSIKLMASYVDNGHPYLMVAEGNNSLYRWDGNGWQNYKIPALSASTPVTQMVSYKNGVAVGFGDGEVWQLFNNVWTMRHDWGFDSPVTQIAVVNNSVAIALGDGAIFQWNGDDNGDCTAGKTACWADLNSPAHGLTVSHLISYLDNNNHTLLAIALSNGISYTNDGTTTWTNIGFVPNATVTQITAYTDPNSPALNSFLIAYSDGRVFQWAPNLGFVLVLTVPSSTPVTQLISYKDTLIAGYQNSLLQVVFKPGNVIETHAISGSGWGSQVMQMQVVNDQLLVRLQNGTIKEWDGNASYNWIDLNLREFTSQQLTLMATYQDHLVLGFGDGSVLQWNGNTSFYFTRLHDESWNSAVVHLLMWHDAPVVALANGQVEQLNNGANSWTEYEGAGTQIPCHGDANYTMQRIQLVTSPVGNQLLVGLSRGDSSQLAENSSSIIEDLSYFQTAIPGSEICVDGSSDSANAYQDEITQMITFQNYVFAGYADGGTIRGWDGFLSDGLVTVHEGGWTSSVSAMSVVNDRLIVGLDNGAIEQWDGDGLSLNIKTWTELHNSSLGSAVSQITESNGTLTVRFANGSVMQRMADGTWITISTGFDSPATQIGIFKGGLVTGLQNGKILQFDNSSNSWSELPDVGTHSAAVQLVDNGNLIVGFSTGEIEQWDGNKWTYVSGYGHAVTQMIVQ